MGGTFYSASARADRTTRLYSQVTTNNMSNTFTQMKEQRAHQDMLPSSMKGFREARDSEAHPNTIPIQLNLDVTGSMMGIPVYMIKEGLPNIIGKLMEAGLPDVALMFAAVGDHESDRAPYQVAQFESGDAELDMWLERVWPEGNGGGNGGESYGIPLFQAAYMTRTDAKDKRGQKGFVFTIGDEPALKNYPGSMFKALYGNNVTETKANYTFEELLTEARKDNHVFHIHVTHNGRLPDATLKSHYGEDFIEVTDQTAIASEIVKKVLQHVAVTTSVVTPTITETSTPVNAGDETDPIVPPTIIL